MSTPLVGITSRRLAAGRVDRWPGPGTGEQQRYVDALQRAGARVALLAPDAGLDAAGADDLVARLDGLVLTGGPDVDPARYGEATHPSVYGVDPIVDHTELLLVDAVLRRPRPFLAICRGLQVLNVACGGTLHQHLPDAPGVATHGAPGTGSTGDEQRHAIQVDPTSALAAIVGAAPTASCHHHQAIACLGTGLRAVAWAADGIVEAVEPDPASLSFGAWWAAVQWHPEDTADTDPVQQGLFDAFVAAARADH